jgi:cytochrome c biogenesis protein CcmG/thiol:disulfide interchange protein DsbE
MRPVLAIVVTALVLTSCAVVGGDDEPLPDVTVTEFGGDRPVEMSSLRGPMVINLWASWCTTCVREMPILEDFHQQHGDQVEVVGIDYQEPDLGAARDLVARTGVTYRLLADDGGDINGARPLPNIQGLPLQVLVDDDGQVAHVAYVEFTSVGQIEGLVSEHLGVDL